MAFFKVNLSGGYNPIFVTATSKFEARVVASERIGSTRTSIVCVYMLPFKSPAQKCDPYGRVFCNA